MVGADLRNLVNEAALLAAEGGRAAGPSRWPTSRDAIEKVLLGAERKDRAQPAVTREADRVPRGRPTRCSGC